MDLWRKTMVVEATRWDGSADEALRILEWVRDCGASGRYTVEEWFKKEILIWSSSSVGIVGLGEPGGASGVVVVGRGDWVIRGFEDEFYVCSSRSFMKIYEAFTP